LSLAEFPRLIDDLLSKDRRRVTLAEIRLEKVAPAAEELLLAAWDDPAPSGHGTTPRRHSPMPRHRDLFARVRRARSEAGLDAARE
jgi:hypothetical protein